jgi:hypothetical protein
MAVLVAMVKFHGKNMQMGVKGERAGRQMGRNGMAELRQGKKYVKHKWGVPPLCGGH